MKRPWMKFYPGDWIQHPGLGLCSLAAQGLWMQMMCLMHLAEPYGHLCVGRKVVDAAALARQVRTAQADVASLLRELDEAGMFATTEHGEIYSPRLVRDGEKYDTAVNNGKKGGNPNLVSSPERSNPPDNRGDNPSQNGRPGKRDKGEDKAQKPEARSQKPE